MTLSQKGSDDISWNSAFGALKAFLWIPIVGICFLFLITKLGSYGKDETPLDVLLPAHFLGFLYVAALSAWNSNLLNQNPRILAFIEKTWGTQPVVLLAASFLIVASVVDSIGGLFLRVLTHLVLAGSCGLVVTVVSSRIAEKHRSIAVQAGGFMIIIGMACSVYLEDFPIRVWLSPSISATPILEQPHLGTFVGYWILSISLVILSSYLMNRSQS